MEGNSTDLQTKYQKLASEYAKIRSQVSVLKKAVIEEQGNTAEIKEVVKEKDQKIRKYEQEIDSLTFRNEQLAKRVSVLQNELDDIQQKPKKGKNKGVSQALPTSSVVGNVYNEELHSKIEENARLHKQVFESDRLHQEIVDELRLKLEHLTQNSDKHQQILDEVTASNRSTIEQLQQDKIRLDKTVSAQEKTLRDALHKASICESELQNLQQRLGSKLSVALRTLEDKLPFNDTEYSELNVLNVPTYDRNHHKAIREFLDQLGPLVESLINGLSNFHTYTEQRVLINPGDENSKSISENNRKFANLLHENASYLRPLEQAFRNLVESYATEDFIVWDLSKGLKSLSETFASYLHYLEKLVPLYLLSLEEESNEPWCSPSLEATNEEFKEHLHRFLNTILKMNASFNSLTQDAQMPRSSEKEILTSISLELQQFYEVLTGASKCYSKKVDLEEQMPTASEKLKVTDECIKSSLISLSTSANKLSCLLASNLNLFLADSWYRLRGTRSNVILRPSTSPFVVQLKRKGAEYLTTLKQDEESPSVPYEEALSNREILQTSTQSKDSLAKQLAICQTKISQLEQAKEHWMLEFQLLQVKFEKEKKKMHKNQLSTTERGDEKMETVQSESLLGNVESTVAFDEPHDVETEIKKYFSKRMEELIKQVQIADSKTVTYQIELASLQQRLSIAENSKSSYFNQLATASDSIENLKEELQTSTRNYESQLSMMTEHLAMMNDKLTGQKDEIDVLKYELINVSSKKGFKGK